MNQARKAGMPLEGPEDADNLAKLEKYEKRLRDAAKFIATVPVNVIGELSSETTDALSEALELLLAAREGIGNADAEAK
jgi:hypothetical protein